MSGLERVVVVGASAAGVAVVEELRARGFAGEIVLVGDEPELPYDRPPLSKQLLSGQWDAERLLLLPSDRWAELDVELVRGVAAIGLDPIARKLQLADGRTLAYDELVIATGAHAVHPPSLGVGLPGVHVLRNLLDALAFRADLVAGGSLAIIGAGFVGAEAAAVAREMGIDVTMIDPQRLPMITALGEDIAQMLADLHTANGVELLCGVGVSEVLSVGERVSGVKLDDGRVVDAGTVLVAVGARPTVGWLAGSGIRLGDRGIDGVEGVLCDETGRAGDGVWAAGDVAAWRDPVSGHNKRYEHRLYATDQGRAVAAALLGAPPAATPLPYFWSDQYDVKLQSYGRIGAGLAMAVVEGSLAERKFIAVYGDSGPQPRRICGVIGAGKARSLRVWRQAVIAAQPWPTPSDTQFERTGS